MVETTLTLREATAADAPRIAALFTDEAYPAGSSQVAARLERVAAAGGSVVVAESGGELLGFIAFTVVPRFEHDDTFVRILALLVDPGVRDRGIGQALMTEVERIGAGIGAAFVEITAGHHRPEARRLYERIGYDAGLTTYLRKRL